ncbi:hypothetical protein AAK873_07365 [Heminiphilus faecis]|uniref:Uncharacterized protein n=1 Tax=Heminiphilus faecis TaxID=2601703 RepID=A0ABV4CVN1_9BACT
MMKVKLGVTSVQVGYTDDELRIKVLGYIDAQSDGVGFRDICDNVLTFAEDEGRIAPGGNDQYQWMQLDRADILRINRILCDEIRGGRLLIDFDVTHYRAADTYFIRP